MDKTSGNENKEFIDWGLLLRKIQEQPLDPEEESRLERWIETSPEHSAYFQKAASEWDSPRPQPFNDFSELERDLLRATGIQPEQEGLKSERKSIYIGKRKWISVAASFIVLTGLTFWLIQTTSQDKRIDKADSIQIAVADREVSHGGHHAKLILASGKSINLEDTESDTDIRDSEGNLISVADGLVTFAENSISSSKEELYNTLVVPRGGEYSLRLPDGSMVWLNSKSSLRFPEHFNAVSRKVYLEGEAFFEICNDKKRNFIVETKLSEVEVYGTSFNIRSYPNEKEQQTTLVAGEIGVKTKDNDITLKPGQQAVITSGLDKIKVQEVDTTAYCSWRKGFFIFEYRRLDDILSQLSDWYDVDFTYADPSLKGLHFTGDLERYADFNDILSLIGMTTNISFDINGNHVTVKRGQE